MSGGVTTTRARAWTVTRRDGLALGFTDHDAPLVIQGLEHRPDSGMSARAVVQGSGLAVDNSEAEGALSHDAITEADIAAGRWDAAEVVLWDVDWTAPEDARNVFRGSLGEIERSGAAFRAELRGLGEALNRPLGRVFHPRCSAVLGDAACGMDLTLPGYRAEAAVTAVEDGRWVRMMLPEGYPAAWFERGLLEVLDGPAAGLSAPIKTDLTLPGEMRDLELWSGLRAELSPGDHVRLTAGCDRTAATCRVKFDNFLNFRGFPHLPTEDWLLAPEKAQ